MYDIILELHVMEHIHVQVYMSKVIITYMYMYMYKVHVTSSKEVKSHTAADTGQSLKGQERVQALLL